MFFIHNFTIFVGAKNNVLAGIGNISVTAYTLESFFPQIKGGNQKVRSLERNKGIIHVKRGALCGQS